MNGKMEMRKMHINQSTHTELLARLNKLASRLASLGLLEHSATAKDAAAEILKLERNLETMQKEWNADVIKLDTQLRYARQAKVLDMQVYGSQILALKEECNRLDAAITKAQKS